MNLHDIEQMRQQVQTQDDCLSIAGKTYRVRLKANYLVTSNCVRLPPLKVNSVRVPS
jgi:hypothetical protein